MVYVRRYYSTLSDKQTAVQKLGYSVGDIVYTIGSKDYTDGTELRFAEDDGTELPWFAVPSENDEIHCEYLWYITKDKPTPATKAVLTPANAGLIIGQKYGIARESKPGCASGRIGEVVTFVEDDESEYPCFDSSDDYCVFVDQLDPYVEPIVTPAQQAGLVIGQKYEVTSMEDYISCPKVGDVLTFTEDDGTALPWFESIEGVRHCQKITSVKPYQADNSLHFAGSRLDIKSLTINSSPVSSGLLTFKMEGFATQEQAKLLRDMVEGE
jgi:hypothetical protein